MSLIKKIFGKKINPRMIIKETHDEIFNILGVDAPTNAQKLNANVYLCICGIAILNEMGRGNLNDLIDVLVSESKNLSKDLNRIKIGDLSNDADKLDKIIADISSGFDDKEKINYSSGVNGLGAFEAIYFTMGQDIMKDVMSHNDGPMGIHGYSAIVIAEAILGDDSENGYIIELSMSLLIFTKKLLA